jgi:hypothetical protein
VILCSWTGARLRPVEHYVRKYRDIFPLAGILVITTSAKDFILRSSKCKQKRLVPAVDFLRDTMKGVPARDWSGILMHVFSEGGSHKACEFAMAYHTATLCPLLVSAMCLDSTPGVPRFRRLCNALALTFPDACCLRSMASAVAFVTLGGMWIVYYAVLGYENNPVSRARVCLLDEKYFSKTAPRCYFYSEEDALVWSKDVEAHATASTTRKIPVTMKKFASEHVMHAQKHANAYWAAVMAVWVQRDQQASKQNCTEGEKKAWHV